LRTLYARVIVVLAVVLIVALAAPSFVAAQPPPVIYYASPINRASSTYILIFGANFGSKEVCTEAAAGGYSGMDTAFDCSSSVGIADLNQGWNAGNDYSSCSCTITVAGYPVFSGRNTIGLLGLTWSDNAITFTGFGNALPAAGYHIHHGDKLLIAVFAPSGVAYAFVYYTGPSF
jgi:hypothetical protein